MIYMANVTIPANTPSTSPVCQRIQVIRGLVYKIEIMFPPGCAGLAHVVINDGGFQVWPATSGTDFSCDDFTISFDDTYLKTVDPIQFQVYGYNEDETYEHTIQVRIGMVDKDIFIARFLPTFAYEHFLKLIKKMETEEKARQQGTLQKPFSWIE
jgi:hypothetical protein